MQFGIDIYQGWNYPVGMRFFIIIILFVMLWLPYLLAAHALLFHQINKSSARLGLVPESGGRGAVSCRDGRGL